MQGFRSGDHTACTKEDWWCEEAKEGFILDKRHDVREEVLLVKSSSIKTSFSLPLVAKVGVKKVPSAPIEKDESGYMNMCVVDLLDLLASKEELTP
jgi:hypothetical protein